ncbi:MAG: hypothetical protein WAX07_08430 [Candidatus Altiarchaeia archaeon]
MRNIIHALILLEIMILLSCQVYAVRMGLVAIFPDGTIYQKCLDAENEASGYDILDQSGLSISWGQSIRWGHQLCAVNRLGCPKDSCPCNQKSKYWNFYLKRIGYSDWEYPDSIESMFDAGSSCQEHYCARDGDIIGLKYGTYGDRPYSYKFPDICPADTGSDLHVQKKERPRAVGFVVASPQNAFSLTVLVVLFVVCVLLGTVRYVRKRK